MKPKKKPSNRRIRPMTNNEVETFSFYLAWAELDKALKNPKTTFDDIAAAAHKAGYRVNISLKPK